MKTNVIALGARYNDFSAMMQEVFLPLAARHLRKQTPTLNTVHLDTASDVQSVGDQISVELPYKLAPMERLANGQASTPDVLNANKVSMKVDTHGAKDISITHREFVTHASANTLPGAITAAIDAIAEGINEDVLKMVLKSTYNVEGGVTGNARNKSDVIAARKRLNQVKAPRSDRFLSLTSESEADLLNILSNASETGDTQAYDGQIGSRFGFDIFADLGMDDVYVGGDAGTEYAVSGAHAAGSNTIAVTTAGATGFKIGDSVSFAGVSGQYVVQEDLSGSGELVVFPGLAEAVADTAVVTALAEHRVDVAYHKSAYGIAFRALEAPQYDSAQGVQIYSYTDPVTGIPMRVMSWIDGPTGTTRWKFEVLYGCKAIRPELATRVLGQ